ncbi:ribose-5-phosphate isomerase RpiA [Parvularcula sp. IMCC14364]|uniref:ribose-5-phosphate isomerase RpiA n=1 Tax=Parvularcula sp. IMCC14364 TaxID=3067902 RepID=UPI0027417E59|nr:ribose-5-phosphate isomerase RpiA [Parvularcula sp. IMCC14364]
MSLDDQKKRAAIAAVDYVKDGMLLGLGTGSTAAHLVRALGEKVRAGLTVQAIPTSEETRELATKEGIELVAPAETTRIDLVIDGADEVDPRKDLIKGGGGALLREKIIASAGTQMIVIADGSKKVSQLGRFPLPVEIDRFSWPLTIQKIRAVLEEAGLAGVGLTLRPGPREAGGGVFRSDGGNYIVDISCARIPDARQLDEALQAIPGVIETGLFIDMADIVIFGTDDGVDIMD